MKATSLCVAVVVALLGAAAEVEFDSDGATPGKWTMDLDAAKQLAEEKQLPILLDFSGSDWCGWCKIMEENVFTQPEWKTYAQENLVMVLLDFPSDKSLVPEKYVERNKALKGEYSVQGYPTFVVLDNDGITELGRLRSGRDKTPESFQAELKNLFRFRPVEIAKYTATLSPEDQAAYRELIDQLGREKAAVKLGEKAEAEAKAKVREFKTAVNNAEQEMVEFRVAHLSEAERKQYEALQVQRQEAKTKLSDWMKTKPDKNDETMAQYTAMQEEIQELDKKISQY
ncbi:thioredoxin family protein [Pontiella sulfatireligans]|uniref:Disulfide bond reductase DsbH n=1 Tax=Pontiella sulfatireligans TaxID=2750658 RepID=A0A6C2UJ39_9BACT|nr:thioredoxin family protein [Pontiella sulfatireligans]VGO19893.1 Disulfide bond reductase DsbH [Pontiella sulfatireligans]